ncbi:hypothetical protein MCHI_001520, partial [Candidatus Magnetoovum chiemensis]
MSNGAGMNVTKPVSLWNKPLNANFKDLFKNLSSAAINGVKGDWYGAADKIAQTAAAIGLADDCPQIAWLLIRVAHFADHY